MLDFGAVPTTTGQMVAGLKRNPMSPLKDAIHPWAQPGAFWQVFVKEKDTS
jgi:hypothetical protein